jgi:putative glutamine amidotransferase
MISEAIERKLPILGICRGAQLLNVHHGGTLFQNLQEFYQEIPKIKTILPKKEITILPSSILGQTIKKKNSRVNALHRQAINKLGHRLTVVATEKTGVIQAIERQSYPFLLGVQWHPEYLPQHQSQRAIFKALVKASLQRNLS